MAERIDPRIPDGSLTTSTYYELETGAVGRDYLQHFYRRAAQAVYPADWQLLTGRLLDGLFVQGTPLSGDQILDILTTTLREETGLIARSAQDGGHPPRHRRAAQRRVGRLPPVAAQPHPPVAGSPQSLHSLGFGPFQLPRRRSGAHSPGRHARQPRRRSQPGHGHDRPGRH
ncbi:MAG: hypothetical protein R2856_36670 [Caldilineaceae bacterium]